MLDSAVTGYPAVAPVAAFSAGLATTVSPCVVSRFGALRALVADSSGVQRCIVAGCFLGGTILAYCLIASVAGLWSRIAIASWTYAIVSLGLAWFGLKQILGRENCTELPGRALQASRGCAFLTGAALGVIGSPCCTPILASIVALGLTPRSGWSSGLVGLCFGLGNALPLMPVMLGLNVKPPCDVLREIEGVVGGGILLSLSAYYALLA